MLGFSERVQPNPEVHGLNRYTSAVIGVTRELSGITTVLFSDTVVLVTDDDSLSSFEALAEASSHLLFALLKHDVPLRGAIAHGTLVRDQHTSHTVIAGRPIIEAHHFESQLQWIGVMLAPSVLRHLGSKDSRSAEGSSFLQEQSRTKPFVQPCDCIPLLGRGETSPGSLEGYAVVPVAKPATTLSEELLQSTAFWRS